MSPNTDTDPILESRVPTLNEMPAAIDHGLPQNCPFFQNAGFLWCSSTTKAGKYAYGVDMWTGDNRLVGTKGIRSPGLGGGVIYSHLFAAK